MGPRPAPALIAPAAPTAVAKAPPVPVARPLLPAAEAVLPYLQRIDAERRYSNFGPLCTELEARLAARLQPGAGVVSASSATAALSTLLRVLSGGAAGLCVIPGFTFVATAHASIGAGLTPWLADVDGAAMALTPARLEAALDAAPGPVRVAVVVAPFGAPLDVDGLLDVSRRRGVPVAIDAAAAFDSLCDVRLPSVVSLHATKAVGAGEGGYVAAADPELLARVRAASSFGFAGSREATCVGGNAKLSEYGAAVALASLDGWPAARLRWMLGARRLRLAAGGGVQFQPGWGADWISSVCVVRTAPGAADALAARLADAGFDSRRWWGRGLHREPAFADLPRRRLPAVERLADSTLGVPFALDMDDADLTRLGRVLARG